MSPTFLTRLAKTFVDEGARTVEVRDGDKVIQMSVEQAIVRQTALKALKGDLSAAKHFLYMAEAAQNRENTQIVQLAEAARAYKEECEEIFADCDERNVPRPKKYPHPDDIIIDPPTLKVTIIGAMSQEEEARHDEVLRLRKRLELAMDRDLARGMAIDDPELQEQIKQAESLNEYLPPKHHVRYEFRTAEDTEEDPASPAVQADPSPETIRERDAMIEEIESLGRQDPMPKEKELRFMDLVRRFTRVNDSLPPEHRRTFDLKGGT
jgi:hypothetical protein